MSKAFSVDLKTGTLNLNFFSSSFKELMGFGSRMNQKRGYLFVSKVIGKHIPLRPSLMFNVYEKMAKEIKKKLDLSLPTLVIGFAETATGLGNGVFDALSLENSFYIHSTRYKTSNKVLLEFNEEHSHAPKHILYYPKNNSHIDIIHNCQNVLLIDDEVSTGKTGDNFVKELKKVLPNCKNYYLSTIVNLTNNIYPSFEYIYLSKASFTFSPKENLLYENIKSIPTTKRCLDDIIPYNFGRYGINNLKIDFSSYVDFNSLRGKKILVLGTGEFMYVPYLFAFYLEKLSLDVHFSATTRSPVNVDCDISSALNFVDNYFEDIDNFLYNVIDNSYDIIFISYETRKLPNNHKLKAKLEDEGFKVEEVFFEL